jgi:hypothetical protein
MANYKKKPDFITTEAGEEFIKALRAMVADNTYNTQSGFSANSQLYPDHLIPFVDKHIDYIRSHPSTDPHHYLSNLRLITRRR